MAEYESDYGYTDGFDDEAERTGYVPDRAGSASGGGEPKMPPRNILETDSAKYTAEYIKEVVKGLYTVPESSYELNSSDDYDEPAEPRSDSRPVPRPVRSEINSKYDSGINSERVTDRRAERQPERQLERQPARPIDRQFERQSERQIERQPDRQSERQFESQPERPIDRQYERQPERQPDWRPEWKTEKTSQRKAEGIEFDTERDIRTEKLFERRNEQRDSGFSSALVDEAERPEPREIMDASRETPGKRRSGKAAQEEEYTSEDFFKSFEEKARNENIDYNPGRRRERKTFSSLRSENTGELEGALSGRPPRKLGAERAEIPERFPEEQREEPPRHPQSYAKPSAPPRASGVPAPDDEFVYLKQVYEPSSSGTASASRSRQPENAEPVVKQSSINEEKIPIIINKNIEGRGMKTADDYTGASKSASDRPRLDPYEPKRRGVSIFSALMAIIAIAVIGALVWKLNALSGELKTVKNNSEEVIRLEGQVRSLSQKNSEQASEMKLLNNRIKELEDENIRLAELARNEPEDVSQDQVEQPAQQTQSHPELVDGYYTVKSGDTLWKISEKFLGRGEDYAKIAAANNFSASQPLYSGLKLKIPLQ